MTRSSWTRFVLGLALLVSPVALIGCGEESKPVETPAAPAADAKPADAKPADAKPADAKPADAKPADAK